MLCCSEHISSKYALFAFLSHKLIFFSCTIFRSIKRIYIGVDINRAVLLFFCKKETLTVEAKDINAFCLGTSKGILTVEHKKNFQGFLKIIFVFTVLSLTRGTYVLTTWQSIVMQHLVHCLTGFFLKVK